MLEKISLSGSYCRVFFIDSGAQETIPSENIFAAPQELSQAAKAKCFIIDDIFPANGIEIWDDSCLPIIEKMIGDQFEPW